MAVTKGHGNPDWSRDETILALDLYFQCEGNVPVSTDPAIVALSNELRTLPFHDNAAKRESFRNPDGVGFKLQNLRQLATGRGLPNVSLVDREVWSDFGGNAALVRELAQKIRAGGTSDEITAQHIAQVDDDEVFFEGRIMTAIHRSRERNPKTRKKLLKTRIALGHLLCDACGEGPKTTVAALASAGFEAHHKIPLAATESRNTKISDLALLCATCHRLIHCAMHQQKRWISVPDFKELLLGQYLI